MTTSTLITAIFDSPVQAGRTVDSLLDDGIDRDRITVLMGEEIHKNLQQPIEAAAEPAAREVARGAGTGALVGGALAALAGFAVTVSGVGLVAAGPLAAMLGLGTLGATAGGLLGSLVGLGIRGDVARVYERDLTRGAVLLGVSTTPEGREGVERILAGGGGHDFARIDRVA